MRRSIVTVIASLLLLVSTIAPASGEGVGGQRFTDVPAGSTHAAAIEWLAASGLSDGCDDGRFCPADPLTRAQAATLLANALGLVPTTAGAADATTAGGDHTTPTRFLDVPADSTHATGIHALTDAGITNGCGDGRFCPADPLTRAQAATLLKGAMRGQQPTLVDDVCSLETTVELVLGPVDVAPIGDDLDACGFVGTTTLTLVRDVAAADDALFTDGEPVDGIGDRAVWTTATDAPFTVGGPLLIVAKGDGVLWVQLVGGEVTPAGAAIKPGPADGVDDGTDGSSTDPGSATDLDAHIAVARKVLVATLGHGSSVPPLNDGTPDKPDDTPTTCEGGSEAIYVKDSGRVLRYCASDTDQLAAACAPPAPGDALPDGGFTTEPCTSTTVDDGGGAVREVVTLATIETWWRVAAGDGYQLTDG